MATIKAIAAVLGVNEKTIRNNRKAGYEPVPLGTKGFDLDESVKAYVRFQSDQIRQLRSNAARLEVGGSGNSEEPNSFEFWKTEKEKEGAKKLANGNRQDEGLLIPVEAMVELYNGPLSLVRSKLLDLTNQIEKRIPMEAQQLEAIEEIVLGALEKLKEREADELQGAIESIIERHSKYFSSSEEAEDYRLGDRERESTSEDI